MPSNYQYQYTPSDIRLGRHVNHDIRSLEFAHGVLPKSARLPQDWNRIAPIMDQKSVGACTGFALAGLLGTNSKKRYASTTVKIVEGSVASYPVINEQLALHLYHLNTLNDGVAGTYPPDDTGSSGLGCGKTGKELGVFKSYLHCFSLAALESALQNGPVLVGIPWLQSMFDTDNKGNIKFDKNSGVAGGHELCLSGWNGKKFRVDNSWGTSWGYNGSGFLTSAQLWYLLSQSGDCLAPIYA